MEDAVSVLVPTYNTAHLLPETLDSILSQTYAASEIIVVDDGSTDATQEALVRFGDRIVYHRVENGGVCRARNIAAKLASSPFLAFCDSDDLWLPHKLAQQMSLHESNPQLDYSFTNFRLVVDGTWAESTKLDDAPEGLFPNFARQAPPFVYGGSLYDQILVFQPIWPSTIVLRRSLFNQLGGFREEFGRNPSEDFEFALRCVAQGPIGIVREPVVGVRRHDANFSRDMEANARGQIAIMEYALGHHPINEATRSILRREIELRHVELSYGAFRRGEFHEVVSHLSNLSSVSLDPKTRLKLWIARLPAPLARAAQSLLLR